MLRSKSTFASREAAKGEGRVRFLKESKSTFLFYSDDQQYSGQFLNEGVSFSNTADVIPPFNPDNSQ